MKFNTGGALWETALPPSPQKLYTHYCAKVLDTLVFTHTHAKSQLFIYFAVVCQTQQEVSVYMSKHSFSPLIFAIH